METLSNQGGAMPGIGVGETACLVCGVTVAHIRSTAPDGSLLGDRDVPVPADYPYCYFCHYNGRAAQHQSDGLLSAISEITGTPATIWHTGGGTMTGVVSLSADEADDWSAHAYFGIVHDDDDDGGVECAGYLSLCIFRDDDGYACSQYEIPMADVPEFFLELNDLWGEAAEDLGIGDLCSYAVCVEWFRRVWPETVRVLEEHRDEWA